MNRALYLGRLAPIGKPFVTRIRGEGVQRIKLGEFACPSRNGAKVRVDHGDVDIGYFSCVIRSHGWWVGSFLLDPNVIDAETEALIRPGAALSIGMDIIRFEIVEPGVGARPAGRVARGLICRTGLIEGASIIERFDFSQRPSPAPPAGPILRSPLAK